jgi:hypothetical protein
VKHVRGGQIERASAEELRWRSSVVSAGVEESIAPAR